MEDHLERKTHETRKQQDASRRLCQEKLESLRMAEEKEHEIDMQRAVCGAAMADLDITLQHTKRQVTHREEFERWRYQVAMEAATEAFEGTAGRFRKMYAVEKLVGNCLHKVTFEQSVQSQTIEEGFQRIREVTGLHDVFDIVNKFLNREVEHDQLKATVIETEGTLQELREAVEETQAESSTLAIA